MANAENLKPFQPGHDPRRNTKGRLKGSRNVSTILKDMLERAAPDGVQKLKIIREFTDIKRGEKLTNAEVLAARFLVNGIIKGDLQYGREIMDRTEGKSIQKTEVENVEKETLAPEVDERINRIYGDSSPVEASED